MMPFVFIWLLVRQLLASPSGASGNLVSVYAWWAMGTALGGVAIYFLGLTLSHLAAFRVETSMRRSAMHKIMTLPLGFFESTTSGRVRKIIDDNASVTHTFLAHQMPDLAASILTPLAAVVLIFVFDWRMGLACLAPIVAAAGLMGTMMGGRGRDFMAKYMSSLEEMNSEAVEYVRGIPVVKAFQQTVFSFKSFHDSIVKYRDMVYAYTMMWEKPMSAYTVIIHGFAYVLVPVAILLMANAGSPADILLNLLFYVLITPVFAQSIMRSMHLNQALGQAAEAVSRTEELTDVAPLPEPVHPRHIRAADIQFSGVSFTYPGATRKAIDDISFTLPAGKTFALVGPSGGGKTTIARLVPRFWDVDAGEVSVGGANVKDIAADELMRGISFVFQNTRLFKISLEDNIRYGAADATAEAVDRAVDAAQCRDIVDRLPDGLATKIGAEGTWLSGGEQQRIALARAILKNAPIIVLDEATAFADPENEHLIHKALQKLTEGKTVLMIAHRLTSVMDADSILVIDEGALVEQGTHPELLANEGLYSRMWNEYRKSVTWTIGKETRV
jgi:ATP-binding cassette subfamily B protein